MKITSIFILTFTCLQLSAAESPQRFGTHATFLVKAENPLPEKSLQDQDREEYAFNHMMSELARVHKGVFSLPFSYEHIKSTLMPMVEAKRKVIAPNYPSREVTGDDPNLVTESFRVWFKTYPQESKDYITYVDSFIAEHSK